MFQAFNAVWGCSGLPLKPRAFSYFVVPTGRNRGMIEFVDNSVPLTKFNWDGILQLPQDDFDELIATAAGGYVAAYNWILVCFYTFRYVLGVRDRHRDNMLIKDGKIFFQIDFG